MSGRAQTGIDVAGVMPVHITKGPPQTIFVRWHGDDVHMVGHQAVRPDFGMGLLGSLGQQIEIKRIVAVFKECAFTPIAALGYVVRNARKDESWEAGHDMRLEQVRRGVNSLGVIARVTVIQFGRVSIKGLLHVSPQFNSIQFRNSIPNSRFIDVVLNSDR